MAKGKRYEKISYPDISFPFVMRTLSIQSYSVPSSLRNHPEIEIQYIHQGSGFYFIKNRKYPLSKNTLLIIHPYEVHNFIPSSSSLYKTSIIFHPKIFSGKFAENIEKLLKFNSKHQIFLTEEEGNEIEIILRRMEKEFREKKKFWKEIIISELFSFVLFINRIASRKQPVQKKSTSHPLVERTISYIEKNFSEKITLFEIAKIINCSPYHLSHIFKKYTGMSFKKYLTVYRISIAKQFLEKTDLKVSAIAMKVGFSNFQSFNISFKKYTGLTPTTYRKFYSQS